MKKLIFLATLFITAPALAQSTLGSFEVPSTPANNTQNVNLNVKTEKSVGELINDNRKAAAARAQADAAKAAAMSDASVNVETPLEVDLLNYTHAALVLSTCVGYNPDWMIDYGKNEKACYKLIANDLKMSPLTIINPFEYDKKKAKKNPAFLREIKNPDWLYLTYRKSLSGVDEIRTVIIRDSKNKVLYKATTTNVPFEETVSVLIDL